MYETFVVLAYLRHVGKFVEVGCASSYGEASRLVREWAVVNEEFAGYGFCFGVFDGGMVVGIFDRIVVNVV